MLERFNMYKAKSVNSRLARYVKLNSKQRSTSEKEIEEMKKISYSYVVGSFMYTMICTRLDIPYAVGVVSCFLANSGNEHWVAIKWIL